MLAEPLAQATLAGFASTRHYTDPHGKPKRLYVCALRRDARRLLSRYGELADY